MRRVLVTGGNGFVGRAVVAALAQAGTPMTLALRTHSAGGYPATARLVPIGSIGPDTEWGEALAEAGAVLHLAAHVHVAPERARAETDVFDEVNHLGTRNLFEQAVAAGIGAFVFLSSITVLGTDSPPGGRFDDGSEPAPATPYARSKLAAEAALAELAARSGARLVVLRPPLVCGPGVGGNLGSLARLAASPLPLPLGGIGNRRTLVSIGNLVSALLAALDREVSGTFCLGDPLPLSTSDIVRELRRGAGRTAPLWPMPVGLVRRLARMSGREGMAQRLLGDLEVSADGFRRAAGWRDAVGTAETLRRTGAALPAARRPLSRADALSC